MPSASRKQRINKNREKLLEYKKTLECKQCGLKDHRVIEFHHVCDKDMNVSTMLKDGYGWSRIQEEINKCIPLCCNCHRIEHFRLIQKKEANAINRYTPESAIHLRLH